MTISTTSIFIGAHQDDDTLLMGAGIVNHKNYGYPVYYACITDGLASTTQEDLNMSDADFRFYRDQEMQAAINAMHITKLEASGGRLPDGGINLGGYDGNEITPTKVNMAVVDRVRDVIAQAASLNGVAVNQVRVKTHSHRDPHPDHRAVCQAVLYLLDLGEIVDVRHYVHTLNWYSNSNGYPSAADLGAIEETCPQVIWLRDALLSYTKTTTVLGGYNGFATHGIGYLSATSLFQPSWDGMHGFYHSPPTLIKTVVAWDDLPVQRIAYATPLYTSADTGSVVIMNMVVKEAAVTKNVLTGSFRNSLGGKIGQYAMVEGYIIDNNMSLVKTSNTNIYARVALNSWTSPARVATGANIPAGARLKAAGGSRGSDILHAYDRGTLVRIQGYWIASTYYDYPCYVNTNWTSGIISNYFVYFA